MPEDATPLPASGGPPGRRRQQILNWLNDYVARWLVVLVGGVALSLGLVSGALASKYFDAGWVEAAGTWASTLATIAAVSVAYVAFRTERYERAVERNLQMLRHSEESIRYSEEAAARQKREAQTASLVDARIGWGHGHFAGVQNGSRMIRVAGLRATVTNASPEPALNVKVHWDGTPPREGSALQIRPADRMHFDWKQGPQDPELIWPEDQAEAALLAEPLLTLRFDMFGSTWIRLGATPPVRQGT